MRGSGREEGCEGVREGGGMRGGQGGRRDERGSGREEG